MAKAASSKASENGGATGPANGVADECLLKTSAAFGEGIDIGRFDDGISVAAKGADGLVVREKEDDIGLFCRDGSKSDHDGQERKRDEKFDE